MQWRLEMTQSQSMVLKPREEMSIGEWLITFLLTSIPVIGFIILLIWSFEEGTRPIRSAWAKAMLIWYLFSFIIGIFILLAALGMNLV